MLKIFEDAKKKMEKANEEYKKLRASCKHSGVQIWKEKYAGWFCEDCETFLPRGMKLRKKAGVKERRKEGRPIT